MSDAPRLVIVADDGGFDEGCDQAIVECIEAGSVRGVAISANGPTAPELCRRLKDERVALGLHLNLTEGRSCAGPVLPLTDDKGAFILSKSETLRALSRGGVALTVAVGTEVSAQLDTFESLAGRPPLFINGHNHVHALPIVRDALKMALSQRGWRPWLRVPQPAPGLEVPEGLREALTETNLQRLAALRALGYPTNDAFVGFEFAADPQIEVAIGEIDRALAAHPTGLIEWMVHPGPRAGSEFCSSRQRAQEHQRLTSVDPLRAHLASRGLEFSGFPRAPTA